MREKSRKYPNIEGPNDLKDLGVEVYTQQKSTYWKELPKLGFSMMKSPPASYQRCLEKLLDEDSQVYAVASDDVILAGYEKNNLGKVRRLETIEGTEAYGVAMLPGQPVLKREVCSAVRKILADRKGWESMYQKNLADLLAPQGPPSLPRRPPSGRGEGRRAPCGAPGGRGPRASAGGQRWVAGAPSARCRPAARPPRRKRAAPAPRPPAAPPVRSGRCPPPRPRGCRCPCRGPSVRAARRSWSRRPASG